jgi:hypothetical protein
MQVISETSFHFESELFISYYFLFSSESNRSSFSLCLLKNENHFIHTISLPISLKFYVLQSDSILTTAPLILLSKYPGVIYLTFLFWRDLDHFNSP